MKDALSAEQTKANKSGVVSGCGSIGLEKNKLGLCVDLSFQIHYKTSHDSMQDKKRHQDVTAQNDSIQCFTLAINVTQICTAMLAYYSGHGLCWARLLAY